MNYSRAIFLINDDVRAVRVQYDPSCASNEYDVFKTFDAEVEKDDMVVVESGTRHKMTVAKVVEVDVDVDIDDTREMRWIVQTIPTEPLENLKAQEGAAIDAIKSAEKRKRRAEMRENLFRDQQEKLKTLELSKINED